MSAKTDDDKITSVVEDYLEAILVLSEEKGYTRVTDLANKLDKNKVSVSEMVKEKLTDLKLVVCEGKERITSIALTDKGRVVAQKVKEQHDILRSFLILIGVSNDNADRDSCVMEHDLSKNTSTQLKYFTQFLHEEEQKDILSRFKKYTQKKITD
ncbi:MAG: metal-dependent transcriptional regulator [Asgard group archaeon]|nr:metal-dependent transcriptional regulator [Asgard group archaeon]